MTTRQPITIYWAGGLFDFKELTANVEIAHAVEKISGGRYQVKLPQLTESNSSRSVFAIRNADLELLLSCDTIVANFDGTDLDSGTVVEFCFAKMVDMPAVLLRTDYRGTVESDVFRISTDRIAYPARNEYVPSTLSTAGRLAEQVGILL